MKKLSGYEKEKMIEIAECVHRSMVSCGGSVFMDKKELRLFGIAEREKLRKKIIDKIGTLTPVEINGRDKSPKAYKEGFLSGGKNYKYFVLKLLAEFEVIS